MGSYLFVGNPENPEGIYNTNVYCKQTANFFEDQDWLSFWELTYGEGIPSQVIMNQTIMVIFDDGIKLWKPHGYLAACGDFNNNEWSEKITIDDKLREQADWKLAKLSDCSRYLFLPFKDNSIYAMTGKVNLETGEIDEQTEIRLPGKGRVNCKFVSKFGIFIEQNGVIFFNCWGSKLWHPITISLTTSIVMDMESEFQFRNYKFYSIEYGRLCSVTIECDVTSEVKVSKSLLHNFADDSINVDGLPLPKLNISISKDSALVIVHYETTTNDDGEAYHNFKVFAQDKLVNSYTIKDIQFSHDYFEFHVLGPYFALTNEHTYYVLKIDEAELSIIDTGVGVYDSANRDYLYLDYWGVVEKILKYQLEELGKEDFEITQDVLNFLTFGPNIINAISESISSVTQIYVSILQRLVSIFGENPRLAAGLILGIETNILYYKGEEHTSSKKVLLKLADSKDSAKEILDLVHTLEQLMNEEKPDLFEGFNARFGHGQEFEEYFDWPSTAVEPTWYGLSDLDSSKWPEIGVLKRMGYAVGSKDGISDHGRRCELLDFIFLSSKLPFVHSYEHMLEWGAASSSTRLKKMANSMATFGRNMRRNGYFAALERYDKDLAYLKDRYYDPGFSGGSWNWPNTEE